eukprot:gene12792-9143_t
MKSIDKLITITTVNPKKNRGKGKARIKMEVKGPEATEPEEYVFLGKRRVARHTSWHQRDHPQVDLEWQEPMDDPEEAAHPHGHETAAAAPSAKAIYQNIHWQLQQELTHHQMEAEQAFFLSAAYKWSVKWLHAGAFYGRYFNAYRFRDGEFLEALRLRCLINPLAHDTHHGGCTLCLCGADITREMTHALDCTRYCGRYLNVRHNLCREAFVNVLRDIPDYSPTIETEVEVGIERKRRADVIIHEAGAAEPIVIDFAVADPAAPRYRAAEEQSHLIAGAAGCDAHCANMRMRAQVRMAMSVCALAH